MSNYERSEGLEKLMGQVIDENSEFAHLCEVRIACQYCDQKKRSQGRRVYADTMIVSDKIESLAYFDFVITFYRPNCEGLDEEHLKRLMYHELLHVGYDDEKFSIIPHDLEDFRECINRWGTNWIHGGE